MPAGDNSGQLPQTGSPLPLLGLLGLGSLVTGLIARKK
jgi:LPXTG-motif cell wall-anchored protein